MGNTVEAQPGTASSVNKSIQIAQAVIKKLISETRSPKAVIKCKGMLEKEVIPCHANEINFIKGYFGKRSE